MNWYSTFNKSTIISSLMLLMLLFFISHRLVSVSGGLLERGASYVVYPVIKMYHHVCDPIKQYYENKKNEKELQQLLAHALEQRNTLQAENNILHGSLLHLQETESLRLFQQRYHQSNTILTQVLVRHFSDQAHYFLVEGGHNRGVAVDMVAVTHNSIVGRVVEVYPWYSKIHLITDRSCKVAALCAQSHATGVHEGTNSDRTLLRYISHLSAVDVGDLVLSSGQGLVFPQGFGLGRIESVTLEGLYQHVIVQPLINLKDVNYCVLMSKADLHSGTTVPKE